MAPTNNKLAELGLRESHLHLAATAFFCQTADSTIDWDKFMSMTGYKNKNTAQTMLAEVKRKVKALEAKNDAEIGGRGADDNKASSSTGKGVKGSAKRKGGLVGDDKETPTKKPKPANKAKKDVKVKNEEVDDEDLTELGTSNAAVKKAAKGKKEELDDDDGFEVDASPAATQVKVSHGMAMAKQMNRATAQGEIKQEQGGEDELDWMFDGVV